MDNFEPTEPLYWRYNKMYAGEMVRSGLGIRFPDFSVNRGGDGFGEPGDVLLPDYLDMGVAMFLVRDLPTGHQSDPNTTYDFRAFHDPLEENYAHTEVRVMKNGTSDRKMNVGSTIKKKLRQMLGERMTIVIDPKA